MPLAIGTTEKKIGVDLGFSYQVLTSEGHSKFDHIKAEIGVIGRSEADFQFFLSTK